MTNSDPAAPVAAGSDPELVAASLTGDREAFGRIVARYQGLVCSLAYSTTGSLEHSEDLAQETFVAAWKDLRGLREPAKLRPWLCGIVRNLAHQSVRRKQREPLRRAEALETIAELPAGEPLPREHAISKEEEAILWRALEQMPENYREPLVLFYREQQSIEHVAQQLDLSEDAVKQRLSRGRKMLADAVAAWVEGVLKSTAPTRALVLGVLAALPVISASAQAATVATAAVAQGGAAAKASAAGMTSVALGAIAGPLVGLLGAWFGIRASLAQATSDQERRLILRFAKVIAGLVLMAVLGMVLLMLAITRPGWIRPATAVAAALSGSLIYAGALIACILRFNQQQRRIRAETAATSAAAGPAGEREVPRRVFEYRSRWALLGLPLVHVRFGRNPEEKVRPAAGWIAIGDVAAGVLFAAGGVAVGGISVGGVTLGVISSGGAALGALAIGGLAIGFAAIGGTALGWMALGGAALGWHAAMGGLASAQHMAVGGVAHALHANDAVAKAYVEAHPFFHWAQQALHHSSWLLLLGLAPIIISLVAARRRVSRTQNAAGNGGGNAK